MEDRHPITRPPRLPIELCEHVIDAVYDYYYQFIVESLATLSKCTLVCRAWRPRAQMMLFESVLIGDTAKLHRFAALLDDSPRLREYVHRLALRGYLHIPASPAVLFPNLTHLYLQDITSKKKLETSLPKGVKELPSVPVHPYFPSLLSTFNHVRRLDLVRIRFCSFGDLCRVLSGLSGLQELSCDNVSWQVFGTLPPGVLKAISNAHPRKPFLSKLRTLNCYDMDEQGRATLVASLGPSVSDMSFTFPNTYLHELPRHRDHPPPHGLSGTEQAPPVLNLEPVPNLVKMVYLITAGMEADECEGDAQVRAAMQAWKATQRDALRATLQSWKATVRTHDPQSITPRRLYLRRRLRRMPAHDYPMQDFVAGLGVVGRLVEEALCEKTAESSQSGLSGIAMNVTVVVLLQEDMLERESPERARVSESFPTFSRHNRLELISEDN